MEKIEIEKVALTKMTPLRKKSFEKGFKREQRLVEPREAALD